MGADGGAVLRYRVPEGVRKNVAEVSEMVAARGRAEFWAARPVYVPPLGPGGREEVVEAEGGGGGGALATPI